MDIFEKIEKTFAQTSILKFFLAEFINMIIKILAV